MKLTKNYLIKLIKEVISEQGYKVQPGRREILMQLGKGDMVKNIERGICPSCGKKINIKDFRNQLSKKEYYISGLCQDCQDSVFGK